jgi:hypothetical protein
MEVLGSPRIVWGEMSKPPPDRWLAVGGTLTTVGAGLGIAYGIYGRQALPVVSFWHPPGYAAVALIALGLVALAIGFFGGRGGAPRGIRQRQWGGDQSTNVQAGGDIRVGHADEDKS